MQGKEEINLCCGTLCNPEKVKGYIEELEEGIKERDKIIHDLLRTFEELGFERVLHS